MSETYDAFGQQAEKNGNGKFISDTQRVVRRHLEDEDDQITEEDIRNVRVGLTPPDTIASSENINDAIEEEVEKQHEKIKTEKGKDETPPADDRITPWDVTT